MYVMPRTTHFLVFTSRDGITVTNALLYEGQLTDVSGFRMSLDGGGISALNELQIKALVGIMRRVEPGETVFYDEAVFYDGNWWADTHAGNDIGGCAKVIRRVSLAA